MIISSLPIEGLSSSYARFSDVVMDMRIYTGLEGLFKSKHCFTSVEILKRSIDLLIMSPPHSIDATTKSIWKACKGRLSNPKDLTEESYITAEFIDQYLPPLIPSFPFPKSVAIVLGVIIEFPCRLVITLILQVGLFLYRAINLDEARYYECRLWSNLYPRAISLLSM